MNKKGLSAVLGFGLLAAALVFILTAFAIIDPFKEGLDDARDTSSLNCQGTPNFNQTAFDLDTDNTINRLTRRTTCVATGFGMVYFVGAFLLAVVVWVTRNWRKI